MKQGIIICCILSVLVIAIVITGMILGPKSLGNIRQHFSEPVSSRSTFSFSAEAGERIKFSFSSEIEEGTLDILLYDSDGNVIHALDQAKELEEWFILDQAGEYILAAEYCNFIGDFKIAVYAK